MHNESEFSGTGNSGLTTEIPRATLPRGLLYYRWYGHPLDRPPESNCWVFGTRQNRPPRPFRLKS